MAPDDHGHVAALTQAANELVQQIQQLNTDSGEQLVTLSRRSTRTRAMVWGVIVSLVVDVALTVVLWQVAIRANDAKVRGEQLHAQQVATCESSNEGRRLNIQLWDYLFKVPPSKPRTPEQDKQIGQFKAYVHKVFADRDCSKI